MFCVELLTEELFSKAEDSNESDANNPFNSIMLNPKIINTSALNIPSILASIVQIFLVKLIPHFKVIYVIYVIYYIYIILLLGKEY